MTSHLIEVIHKTHYPFLNDAFLLFTGHNYLPLRPGHSTESDSCDVIREVPRGDSTLRFIFPDGIGYFYDKYTEAYGIPVMGEDLQTINRKY